MFGSKMNAFVRVFVILGVLGLGGFYGGRFLFNKNANAGSPVVPSLAESPAISTKDIPESLAKEISSTVSGVAGIDQMVVLPAVGGHGYSVTAQVDMGAGSGNTTDMSDKIQAETTKYFNQIFENEKDVVDAELYFLVNGQIVASAGLGTRAYHELAAKAGVVPYNLTVSLESMPTVTGQGENNSWFEIGNME